MPDLTTNAIESWLDAHGSEAVAHLAQSRPPEEETDVLPAVIALGTILDFSCASARAPLEALLLADPAAEGLRTVMAHFGGPRRMRLLHWLTECGFTDVHSVLARLTEADPSGTGPFLSAWIADLHRRQVLERIFDSARITALFAACKEADSQEKTA